MKKFIVLILLGLFLVGCDNILDKSDDNSDSVIYYDFTEGTGIKYNVTDEFGSLDCNIWAISQKVPTSLSGDYYSIVTLIKEGSEGRYFSNSTLGGKINNNGLFDYFSFYHGMGVGNQANFYQNIFQLKDSLSAGDTYVIEGLGSYTAEDGGTVTLNGVIFEDCIKIIFTRDVEGNTYTNGTGYGLFAPNVGLVKLEFIRSNSTDSWANNKVVYSYIESESFTAHTISGNVTTDGTTVASDLYIQIASRILDETSKTDANGDFTLSNIYGPDILLKLGYDGNDSNVGILDFGYPNDKFVREYIKNDVTDDITGMNVNLESD